MRALRSAADRHIGFAGTVLVSRGAADRVSGCRAAADRELQTLRSVMQRLESGHVDGLDAGIQHLLATYEENLEHLVLVRAMNQRPDP